MRSLHFIRSTRFVLADGFSRPSSPFRLFSAATNELETSSATTYKGSHSVLVAVKNEVLRARRKGGKTTSRVADHYTSDRHERTIFLLDSERQNHVFAEIAFAFPTEKTVNQTGQSRATCPLFW